MEEIKRYKSFVFVHTLSVLKYSCACGGDEAAKQPESCWYTYWYVWLALGLFIAVLITIIVVYVKHKSKRTRRSVVRRISIMHHPQNPPAYGTPSQRPPSYEDAIKTSYPVPPGYSGGHIQFQELQAYRLPSEVRSNPPSYVDSNPNSR